MKEFFMKHCSVRKSVYFYDLTHLLYRTVKTEPSIFLNRTSPNRTVTSLTNTIDTFTVSLFRQVHVLVDQCHMHNACVVDSIMDADICPPSAVTQTSVVSNAAAADSLASCTYDTVDCSSYSTASACYDHPRVTMDKLIRVPKKRHL